MRTDVAPSGTGSLPSVETYAEYDPAGQLALLVHYTDETALELYEITRDSRGNPTRVDTTTGDAGSGDVTTSAVYSYDKVSRIEPGAVPIVDGIASGANAPTIVVNPPTQEQKTGFWLGVLSATLMVLGVVPGPATAPAQ